MLQGTAALFDRTGSLPGLFQRLMAKDALQRKGVTPVHEVTRCERMTQEVDVQPRNSGLFGQPREDELDRVLRHRPTVQAQEEPVLNYRLL